MVCPLIEESEKTPVESKLSFDSLKDGALFDLRLGLIHGYEGRKRMIMSESQEKDVLYLLLYK